MRNPHRKFLSLGNHFFERLKTADSSTAYGTSTWKSPLLLGSDAPHVHPRLRKHPPRCTLDCGFQTSESPALRGFVGGSQALATAALYLVLKSNGLHHSKNLPVKFGFSPKPIPTNIAKKLSPQRCSQPLVIAFFNFSRKRPTFAFTGESGYTLGSLRKIAHSALHAETGVLHSCEAKRNISLPPPRAKEQPEEADTRLLRVSASSGAAAPLGCATLFAIWRCYCFFALHAGLPTCAR